MPSLDLPTDIAGCRVRAWSAADADDLARHANHRGVWRNLADVFPHPYTRADAQAWVEAASAPSEDLQAAVTWQGQAVGGIGILAGQGVFRHNGLLGYWLGESVWGRGLATAAVRAMTAHVLAAGRWSRLEALVFGWNPASMRVLEKAGYVREGVRRNAVFKDGQFTDAVMYARCI